MKHIERIYLLFFIVNALLYFPFILDPVLIPRFTLLAIFLLLILGFLLSKNSLPPFEINLAGMLVLAFPFFYLINLGKAIYPGEAIYFFAKELMLSIFFLVTIYFLKNNLLPKKQLIKSVFAFALILSGVAIIQIVIEVLSGQFSIYNILFLKSTAANKNLLSIVLFFGTSAALLMHIEEKKQNYLLAIGLFVLLIAFLQTRSVWFAGLVFLACIAPRKLLSGNKNFIFLKQKKWLAGVLLSTVILTLICVVYFNYTYLSSAHTMNIRFLLWDNTIHMINDHIFLGVGGGNWQIHFPEYGLQNFDKPISDGYLTYQRPHNDFLWVFAETGILGFLVFISIFIASLYSLFRFISRTSELKELNTARIIAGCLLGFLVISFFDFPLERMEHRELLYIFLALSAQYQFETGSSYRQFNFNKVILNVLILFLLFFLVIGYQKLCGEYHQRKMLKYKSHANWNEVILESTKSKNFFFELDPFSVPVSWYAGVAYFNLNNIPAAKENFERAFRFHPYNIHVLNNLAGCYEKESDHQNAIHYYTEALRISPSFEESRLNLSASYFNSGDIVNAYASIQKISPECTHPNYPVYKNAIETKYKEGH